VGRRSLTTDEVTARAVESYIAALNAHDPDRIAACVAADFVNEHTAATGHSLVGRAAYRRRLESFLAEFTQLRYEIEQLVVDGGRAAVPYRMSFRLASAGGRPVSIRGVFVFRVDAGGAIAHRTDYWDSGEVQRQLS
jgi:steroid delta-isomerase-like uncharacterized protein